MKLFQVTIYVIAVCFFSLKAHETIRFLDSVPKEFEEKYRQQRHNYNPLNLGNYWQYASETGFLNEYIVKDTIVNNKRYYKKFDYRDEFRKQGYFYNWERNDTVKQSTYMLDWENLDSDGLNDDELLLDSLEIQNYHEYTSYRHTWKDDFIFNYPSTARIVDSSWVIVFHDTVMSRYIQYLEHFDEELFADKYGVILIQPEQSAPIILTGAIIDSVQYGNIVFIENKFQPHLPNKIKLFQNYPNPFNNSTLIPYDIYEPSFIAITVYDALGEKITTLLNEFKYPGSYKVEFESKKLPTGVYFCNLKGGSINNTMRMIFIK